MNSHFPLPKIRTIGDELTLSLSFPSFSLWPTPIDRVSPNRCLKARHEAVSFEAAEWSERLTSRRVGWLGAVVAGSIPALVTFFSFSSSLSLLTFPYQKFALFVSPFTLPVSPFTERSPLWRWNSQWVHSFHCQKFFRPLCSPSFKWHEPRDEWSKTQDKWSNPAQSYFVLPIEKMNQINTKNYWNKKKRLCVRWLGVINLTWENLQNAKHRTQSTNQVGVRSFSLADWFVLCDL